jgi:hypothetical protein
MRKAEGEEEEEDKFTGNNIDRDYLRSIKNFWTCEGVSKRWFLLGRSSGDENRRGM